MTSRVFVPLVSADGSGQQLFEALASMDAPDDHPAKLVPQIAELHDFGLYRIGQTVREAVTRFTELRRAKVWLGRRNARTAPWFLRISELQVGRLSDENARSAGLGLAVAALLTSFAKPAEVIFATGEILLPKDPTATAVGVGAVDGIRGKLGLVGDYIAAHRGALAGRRVHLLLPAESTDGRLLMDAEARSLSRLMRAAEEADIDLKVTPIGALDDLGKAFGPFEMDPVISRGAALLGAGVTAIAAAVFGAWAFLAAAPVALAWVAVDGKTDGVAEPRRARYNGSSDRLEVLPACLDDQRQPVVLGGETLLLRVTARETRPFASLVAPARFFIVSVSRSADPVVLDASLFRTAGDVQPGMLTDAVAAIPVEPTEDEIRLFVVATRDGSTSLTEVTEDLRQHLKDTTGAAALTSTTQFLNDRFDGLIDYQFKVTTDATRCP